MKEEGREKPEGGEGDSDSRSRRKEGEGNLL
jgi:hypothetical protein